MISVLGADLAQRHSGFCFIPGGWDGRFESLVTDFCEYGAKGRIEDSTAIEIMLTAARTAVNLARRTKPDEIVVEEYAYRAKGNAVHRQAEIGGVVRSQLRLAVGIAAGLVPMGTARSFLIGGSLRGKRKADKKNGVKPLEKKDQILAFLANRGFSFPTDDVSDAFVVGYYHYCQRNGLDCMFDPILESEQVVKL